MAKGFSVAFGVLLLCASIGLVQGKTTVETATAANKVEDSHAAKPPFFADHARGWHWYERLALKKPASERPAPKGQVPKKPAPVTSDSVTDPSAVVEKYRKLIVQAQDQALMDPSPENLYRYMSLQQDAMARSHRFAKNWQQLLLSRPELDDTVKFPTTQGARHVVYAHERQETAAAITALKDTHGLYFFFSEDCPYCHAFAPIVKAFAQKHEWTVFAIQMGGSPRGDVSQAGLSSVTSDFPKAVRDNGFGARLGVRSLPALFAANPSAGQIIHIAHNMISEAEIESRILMITQRDWSQGGRPQRDQSQGNSLQGNLLQGSQLQGNQLQGRKE